MRRPKMARDERPREIAIDRTAALVLLALIQCTVAILLGATGLRAVVALLEVAR